MTNKDILEKARVKNISVKRNMPDLPGQTFIEICFADDTHFGISIDGFNGTTILRGIQDAFNSKLTELEGVEKSI